MVPEAIFFFPLLGFYPPHGAIRLSNRANGSASAPKIFER